MGMSSHPDWDWVQVGSSYTAPHGDLSDDYDYRDLGGHENFSSGWSGSDYADTFAPPTHDLALTPPGSDLGIYDHYSPTGADYTIGDPDSDLQVWHQQERPDTCAIAAQEFILDSVTGQDFSEDALTQEAMANGWYQPGGTALSDVGNLLEAHGVAVEREVGATLQDVARELDSGHKVIAAVNSEDVWNAGHPDGGSLSLDAYPGIPGQPADHVIEVIGIDQSDPANPEVILNDPGTPGGRGLEVAADDFSQAWAASDNFMVHTDGAGGAAADTGPLLGSGTADGTKKVWETSNYTYEEEDVWQSADGKKAYANVSDYYADKPITDTYGYTDPKYRSR